MDEKDYGTKVSVPWRSENPTDNGCRTSKTASLTSGCQMGASMSLIPIDRSSGYFPESLGRRWCLRGQSTFGGQTYRAFKLTGCLDG